jgi:threonine/homoserine/homoserine lactone efflux protein
LEQEAFNLKEYSTNLGNPKILKIFVQTMGEFVRKEQSKIDYYY